MKRLLFLLVLLVLACFQAGARIIKIDQAQTTAQNFVNNLIDDAQGGGGSVNWVQSTNVVFELLNKDGNDTVLYIVNTKLGFGLGGRFVIVAGDDNAGPILAYGDGLFDPDDIPEGLMILLEWYQEQIEYLMENGGGSMRSVKSSLNLESYPQKVDVLLVDKNSGDTIKWSQNDPYNRECPLYYGTHCVTGCGATALAQVMKMYEYPMRCDSLPSYTTNTLRIPVNTLPPISFEWNKMKNSFMGDENDDEKDAVAWLMRYAGQAATMDYGTRGSYTALGRILTALNTFGYNGTWLWKKNTFTDDEWQEIMLKELSFSHPIIYYAFDDSTTSVHIFDIDGYEIKSGSVHFHINWGHNGNGNGHFIFNHFVDSLSPLFNHPFNRAPQMITDIAPIEPSITVDVDSLDFGQVKLDETKSLTFSVTGTGLTGDLTVSSSNSHFTVSPATISASKAASGATVSVTFSPTEVGTSSASVTISGGGICGIYDADPVTVTLSGTAIEPEFTVSPETLSFNTDTGVPLSKTFSITGAVLSDLALTLNDDSGTFFIDKTSITPNEVAGSATVTVTYSPTTDGSHNASITISGGGAEAKTVALEGCAVTPGIPVITTDASDVIFESTYTGYQTSRTITITCPNLLNDLELNLIRDNTNSFGLSKQTITPEEAAAGAPVTVYFRPTSGGGKHATLNIKSDGAETVSIPVSGYGIKSDGCITAWPISLEFEAQPGTTVTKTFNVSYSYSYPNESIMISSVGSGGEAGSNGDGGSEGALLSLNEAISGLSWTNTTIIPFDGNSMTSRFKELIGPIEPGVIIPIAPGSGVIITYFNSLVLELTGDDCFEITPARIGLLNVPCSAIVTVTYHPDCEGDNNATIKIKKSRGSAKPFILPVYGSATGQLKAPSYDNDGNGLMITQSGSSINTLVDEMLMNIKVYAEGQTIIIVSPEDQRAVISDVAGHTWNVDLQAGRNEIPVNASGVFIVRTREKTTKLMLK